MEHVVRAVTVAEPEIERRRIDRDVGRTEVQAGGAARTLGARALLISARFLRIAHGPDLLTLERALGHQTMALIGEVQVLGIAFLLNVHAVRAVAEHLPEAAHEAALGVEHHHGVADGAVRVHGVVDVHIAMLVDDHVVRVAITQACGQAVLTPVMLHFKDVLALTHDRQLRARLVVCAKNRRRCHHSRRGRSCRDELAPRNTGCRHRTYVFRVHASP